MQLGAGQPSTILGGVEELMTARQYPLAALVFFASIAVPMLKLIGLSVMLITIQTGRTGWLRDRTRLYHIVRFIGRWSMIDIFMASLRPTSAGGRRFRPRTWSGSRRRRRRGRRRRARAERDQRAERRGGARGGGNTRQSEARSR